MKKYLIRENAELAQANIKNMEERFIAPLKLVAHAINGLGLDVTKENLFDAITNDGKVLLQLFKESRNYGEMDERLASVAEDVDNKKIHALYESLSPFRSTTTIYNGKNIKDPEMLSWVGINEDGTVYLLDSTKDEIIESVKEYCSTKSGRDLFDLHQKIAKELQVLYDGMNAIRKEPGKSLSFEAGAAMLYFPNALFDIRSNDDGDMLIQPRNINFDAVEDEDFDLDDE